MQKKNGRKLKGYIPMIRVPEQLEVDTYDCLENSTYKDISEYIRAAIRLMNEKTKRESGE